MNNDELNRLAEIINIYLRESNSTFFVAVCTRENTFISSNARGLDVPFLPLSDLISRLVDAIPVSESKTKH